jgi:HEAT repeat protein
VAKESLETLIPELTHEEDWRRMRATAACLAGGPRAVNGLIEALHSGNAALTVEAIGLLARIKDPRAGVPLIRLLREEDAGVRKAVVLALEQMAGVLDEEAATALVNELHAIQDEDHRRLIVNLLGVLPQCIQPLCAMLKHPEPQVRLTAWEILDHLLEPASADALVDAMGDPAIRDGAVQTLKKLATIRERIEQAFDRLRDIEDSVEREEARMAAVIDLLPVGRRGVQILIEYLDDEEWVVREAAGDLLGKIGDIRAVEPLMKRLREDKDTGVKEYAIKGLGLIGDARPVDMLVDALPIRPLRTLAMEALAKIKEAERLRPYADLFEKLSTDRDGLVSYNATLITTKLQALAGQQATQGEAADDDG